MVVRLGTVTEAASWRVVMMATSLPSMVTLPPTLSTACSTSMVTYCLGLMRGRTFSSRPMFWYSKVLRMVPPTVVLLLVGTGRFSPTMMLASVLSVVRITGVASTFESPEPAAAEMMASRLRS